MKVLYRLEVADLVALSCHHYRVMRKGRKIRSALMTFVVCLLAQRIGWGGSLQAIHFVSAAMIVAILELVWPYVADWSIGLYVRRIFASGGHPGILGEHELELTTEGLVERTSVGESRVAWRGIERIAIDGRHTFVYLGGPTAHVVPQHIDAGDYGSFVAELMQRWEAGRWGESRSRG